MSVVSNGWIWPSCQTMIGTCSGSVEITRLLVSKIYIRRMCLKIHCNEIYAVTSTRQLDLMILNPAIRQYRKRAVYGTMPKAGSQWTSVIQSPIFSTRVRLGFSSGTPYEVVPHVSYTAGPWPDRACLNDVIFEISEVIARHIFKNR